MGEGKINISKFQIKLKAIGITGSYKWRTFKFIDKSRVTGLLFHLYLFLKS